MTYDDLLHEGRIRPHGFPDERLRASIHSCLELAARELSDSAVEGVSLDGRYEHAYAAVRALAEVVMLAEGFRPASGPGQHQVVFDFLRMMPTPQWQAEAQYFDACRQRRHTVAYRRPREVTETELRELMEEAERFRDTVRDWLAEHHPALVTP